ncbi:MAG: alanine/glycine:cation symporter family protein [Planctomycetaceae bacterium]
MRASRTLNGTDRKPGQSARWLVLLLLLLAVTATASAQPGQTDLPPSASGAGADVATSGPIVPPPPPPTEANELLAAEKSTAEKIQDQINGSFESVVGVMISVLFYKVPLFVGDHTAPFILLVLIFGGIFFTFRFGFINIRLFSHSINVIRGKYDKPEDKGEITHFQALTSALSATVGLGNIGGVAIAIALGGPGAIFWMWCIAFFGMSAKFASCSFAQLYRRVKPDGTVLGGPMVYLEEGIKEHFPRLGGLGKVFGIAFAVFTILASLGGGNMFQGNQTFKILSTTVTPLQDYGLVVGIVMAALVGIVIIGGIKRIGEVTSKMVPAMCLFYCACCLVILLNNIAQVPAMFASIFVSAFQPDAVFSGGMVGVLLMGARRAAFSNEAGLGSAAIAHAAARTEEPVREGVVAMIGPFIDTIVVCTMTALTILITNAHIDVDTGKPFVEELAKQKDVALTAAAFASLGTWVPYLLCGAVAVFAYSTMISWSYYGERSAEFLFGEQGIKPYRLLFVLFVALGPIVSLKTVLDFSDMMLFSMAFPNIIGLILLSGVLRKKAQNYVDRLKSGEISRTQ